MPDAVPNALPEGFVEERRGGVRVVARAEFRDAIVAAGFLDRDPDPDGEAAPDGPAGPAGRGRLVRIPLPAGGALLARLYRRGGLLGPLLGALHLGAERPLRELRLTVDAAAAGVPTLEAVGVVIRSVAPLLYRFWLITREVDGARDLLAFLRDERDPRTRSDGLAASARAIAALHAAGVDHADLNLKNILVLSGEPGAPIRALVIDLDKSRASAGGLGEGGRTANVLRLFRSLEKQTHIAGAPLASAREAVRFLRAYAGRDRATVRRLCDLARQAADRRFARRLLWRQPAAG